MNLANYNVGKKHELCLLIEIYFEVKKAHVAWAFLNEDKRKVLYAVVHIKFYWVRGRV